MLTEKKSLEQFSEWAALTGNDEKIDPQEEAEFWASEEGQKMSKTFSSPEHKEFLRKLEALRTSSMSGESETE